MPGPSRARIRQARVRGRPQYGRHDRSEIWVGVDVSKQRWDVAVRPWEEAWSMKNDQGGIKALVGKLKKLAPQRIVLEASDCRVIDSRRRYVTNLDLISFDDAETCTSAFAALVQWLLTLSEDHRAHYMVLDPDPV